MKFGVSKTLRHDVFVKKTTLPSVGPGSYEFWNKEVGHKIPNPTIPRETKSKSMFGGGVSHSVNNKKRRKNHASIRENFEDYSDSDSDDDTGSMSAFS